MAAHVLVNRAIERQFRLISLAVQAFFQDGLDALIRTGAKAQRPSTGGFQSLRAHSLAQTNDAQAGAKTHLGVWPVLEDLLHELGALGTGLARPVDESGRGSTPGNAGGS